MRNRRIYLLALLSACTLLFPLTANGQGPGERVPDRFIVQVQEGVAPEAVIAKHGLAPDFVYHVAAHGFAGRIPPGQRRGLENDPAVAFLVPDRVVSVVAKPDAKPDKPDKPGKPPKDDGGGDDPTDQVVPAGVARIGAGSGQALTGAGVGVAIVDTGIDASHADLVVAAASFSAYGGSAQDDEGHGTHVSGIVAALDDDADVVGVAPGVTLYAVKVLDSNGEGYDSTILAGLEWVLANSESVSPPIRVVNMSLGRPGDVDDNPVLREAMVNLHAAGISIVVAAGNESGFEVSDRVPATYPEVMAVASTTASQGRSKYRFYRQGIGADTASFFTTDGAFDPVTGIGVTISAPGEKQEDITRAGFIEVVGILSTQLGGGTTRMSGTSMSAPHVTGVVARILESNGGSLDPESVRAQIRADAAGAGTTPYDSPTTGYSFDAEREGVVTAP